MKPFLPLLILLCICHSDCLWASENREKPLHGKYITRHKNRRRKGIRAIPSHEELERRFNEMAKKNREQGRKMTLHERYDEIADMLADARTKAFMGMREEANVLLSDAWNEYRLYGNAFREKRLPILALEESLSETVRALGVKEKK